MDQAATSGRQDFAEVPSGSGSRTHDPRRGYYAIKIAATVGALGALVPIAIVIGNSWWNLLVAVGLAFVLAQLGFIGHDAGHRQVSGDRRRNDLIGLFLTNLLTGVSFGWWLTKHSRHHAHTNQPGSDPDLTPGALVYTRAQMCERRGLGRSGWVMIQVALSGAAPLLEAHNLHLSSVIAVGRRRDRAAWPRADFSWPTPPLLRGPFPGPFTAPSPGLRGCQPVLVRLLPGAQLSHQPRGDAYAGADRRARDSSINRC